jgi:c-di-GMP-binding flagellar brake protein YcgR
VDGILILRQTEPQRLLQTVYNENIPMFISYLSARKWQIARAKITDVSEKCFKVKITPQKVTTPVMLHPGQTVGISFKYGFEQGYGRFVFGAEVAAVEQASDLSCLGSVSLAMPEEIEVIQRRSYQRIMTPEKLNISVSIWSRSFLGGGRGMPAAEVSQSWTGKLVDISAGGLAVAISMSQGPLLEEGQFVSLKLTPLPNQTPLAFNVYVKSVSQTAAGDNVCVGMEMVGLEASSEGRLVLQRLCNVVEQYSKMNTESRIQKPK